MNFRILHLSDLHAGLKLEEDQTARTTQNFCQQLYERIESSWRTLSLNIDLLVISGDLISGDLLQDHNSEEQFRYVCDEFISKLQDLLNLDRERTVIVPGNHDVDRKGRAVEWGLDNFYDRVKYMANLPAKIPDVSILNPREDLLVWPVSSVPLAGQEDQGIKDYIEENIIEHQEQKIPVVDPAYVSPYCMIKCKNELNDKRQRIKIAVIHHNPLSFKDEGTYFEIEKYRFINDGQFNHFLVNNGFQIVLHGHQHRGRVAFFSTNERINNDHLSNRGFLCIGAPSFGGNRNFLGYNIVNIETDNAYSSTASVTIQTVAVDPSENKKFGPYLISLDIDINQDSQKLLFEIGRDIFNNKNISKYKRIIEPDQTTTKIHFDYLRDRFSLHKGTRAIYSLSVFPPEKWGAQQLTEFFLPHGKKNIARAVALATRNEYHQLVDQELDESIRTRIRQLFDLGHPGLHFLFSPPLCQAIETARKNSQTMRIAEIAKQQWKDQESPLFIKFNNRSNFDIRMFLNKNFASTDNFSSISIWDNAGFAEDFNLEDSISDDIEQLNYPGSDLGIVDSDLSTIPYLDDIYVTFSKLPETPKENWAHSDPKSWLPSLLEFPRIVLWGLEEFKKPEAIQCIIFHEEFGLPLFWLNPDALRTHITRKRIGYVSIFSRRDENNRPRKSVDELWNDQQGQIPDERIELQKIWENNSNLPIELRTDSRLIEEYFLLLKRRDIMFAADVWAMVNMGEDIKHSFDEEISQINNEANQDNNWFSG